MKIGFRRLVGAKIFESAHLSHDLRNKSIRGGGAMLTSQGMLFGINLVRSIILARLLTPHDFGLVGMVIVFINFAVMFKDAGLSMATIQRASITEAQISSLFWCNIVLSIGLGMLICMVAPLVSIFYRMPELTLITIALSGSFIFSGFQIQHLALLKRHMFFAQIAVVNVLSSIIGLIIAVFLAFNRASYWALVGMFWAKAISALLLTLYFCPWRPKRFQRGVGLRPLLTFGGHLTGFNLLNFFSSNLDSVLIGRFLGTEQLGIYQRAHTLMMQPLLNLHVPLSIVGTPALSRLQNNPERYRKYFLQVAGFLLMITMPLAAFFIVMSSEIILVLFGAQWEASVKPFMYLSLCIISKPLASISGWLFISQGRSKEMIAYGIVFSSLTIASITLGLLWGINGVAACYSFFGILSLPLIFWFGGRRGPVTILDFYVIFGKRFIYFVGFMVLLLPTRLVLILMGLSDFWVLCFQGIIFGIGFGGVFLVSSDAKMFLKKFLGR